MDNPLVLFRPAGLETGGTYDASVSAIVDAFDSRLLGAMRAAVDLALRLGAVTDHPAFAVRASGAMA